MTHWVHHVPLVLLLAGFSAYGARPYDSAEQVILDGSIEKGSILVKDSTEDPEPQIREQLRYTLGQFNWEDAAPKVSWFKIHVEDREDLDDDSGLVRVHYRALGHIAWSREKDIPKRMELVLPARADKEGLESFADHYFKPCNNDSEATREGFFYYFFPKLDSCPLHDPDDDELDRERGHVVRFKIGLKTSDTNTKGKAPEYNRLWAGGKLSVTLIFGKYHPDARSDGDAGINAYNRFYDLLIGYYGAPALSNHWFQGEPGTQYPLLKLHYQRPAGELEIQMRLVDAMTKPDDEFTDWYKSRTADSDVLIYNGHAGLGDNVQALADLATFTQGRYQVFFVNGCDTFTYLNERLFNAHAAANPGYEPSKFLDIITNSMSNYFSKMAEESFILIDELQNQNKTYREIFEKFDPRQRTIVDGEQDNP